MNITLENFNVLISKKSVYFRIKCLFFTNFVLVFHKIFKKRAYFKVFTYVREKGCFLVKDQVKAFLVFSSVLFDPGRNQKVGLRRL